ncbi:MAG: Tat pathway signal sequence, partial [Chloroflexi bacterium]|nr:Tat pathway signal sequence [Chloroflexota bacterium]
VPGQFETFLSYEWHSIHDGDHHVVYRGDHGPLLGGERIWDLKAALRGAAERGEAPAALAIPHHIGYGAGYRGINWETFTPEMSPFVEIFSLHGCSESDEAPYPMLHRMGPRDGQATAAWGLQQGHRVGLVASTDHHSGYPGSYGDGRQAVAARELTREALWEGFLARRVYAATGDRIWLDFHVNDNWMGAEFSAVGQREIRIDVRGRGAIDYVELLKNERALRRWSGPDPARAVEYAGTPRPVRTLVRIEWGWGGEERPVPWECCLSLPDGQLLDVETCFAGPAIVAPQEHYEESERLPHEVLARDATSVAWRSETVPNPTVRHPATQALIVEVELTPGAELVLEANGRRYRHTLAELLEASSSHFLRGWRSEAIVLHRALPAELCRVTGTVEDEPRAVEGTDCYRVRVAQRNGQWAWSSPAWVEA